MKVELDLGAHEDKLRLLERERENYRVAKERMRLAENERYTAQSVLEDAKKRLAQAEGDVASAFLKDVLPKLNEAQAAQCADVAAQPESNETKER